uniref:Uncharacterized protein n=1 Tax=Romanomermis culicivorax TaxID=13658 RepID=A0A915IKB0_ROMCU
MLVCDAWSSTAFDLHSEARLKISRCANWVHFDFSQLTYRPLSRNLLERDFSFEEQKLRANL